MATPTTRTTTRPTTLGDVIDPDTETVTATSEPGHHQTIPGLSNLSLGGLVEPKRVLWLGGLVGLGVIGLLEWPVVAAVGVGSYVAERFAKSDTRAAQTHPTGPSV